MPAEPLTDARLAALGLPPDVWRRVRMTASCGDCRTIPKAVGAGDVSDFNGTRIQTMHNGVRVTADGYCGPWMTEIIRALGGHHEPQEEWAFHLLLRHARPGTRILELGSYWAYYSLWFLKAVPHGRATLVEPDPAYLAVGRENFAVNNAAGEFLEGCVGDEPRETRTFHCESGGTRDVRQYTVDELLARPVAEPVEILLADIQGAELAMLRGATKSLKSGKVRFLVLSTHHHSIAGDPLIHRKCAEFVAAHGGRVLSEHDVHESYSGDGLIVATFDPADAAIPPIRVSCNRPVQSLFRPLEYDLAEAWEALERLKASRLDVGHSQPKRRWPSFGRWLRKRDATKS